MAFLAVFPPTEQKLRRFLSFLSHSPSICRLWKGGRGGPPGVRGGDSSRGVTGGAAPAQAHSDTDPGLRGTPDQGCPKAMSPVSQAGKLVRDVDAAVRRARQLGPVSPWLLDTSPPPAPRWPLLPASLRPPSRRCPQRVGGSSPCVTGYVAHGKRLAPSRPLAYKP